MLGSRSTLWVVVMSGQCVLGSLTHFGWFAKCPKCGGTPPHFRYLSPHFGYFRGTTQSELTHPLPNQITKIWLQIHNLTLSAFIEFVYWSSCHCFIAVRSYTLLTVDVHLLLLDPVCLSTFNASFYLQTHSTTSLVPETTSQICMLCKRYDVFRANIALHILIKCFNVQTLLHGSNRYSDGQNVSVQGFAQQFIMAWTRF